MENYFTRAIVCPPSPNFAEGLTTVSLGRPVFERAVEQHRAYCDALEAAGLRVITLEPDAEYPDSTFVENAAVLTPDWAVITRPGAASRSGEIVRMAAVLSEYYRLTLYMPPAPSMAVTYARSGTGLLSGSQSVQTKMVPVS